MTIRRSRPEDAAALAKLARDTIRTINVKDHTEEIMKAWSKGNTAAAYRRMEKEHIRYVAVEHGRIIGFTDMLPDGELMSLYLHKDRNRRGVGKKLLAVIEDKASTMGIKKMSCRSSVNAKGFYEKHGYRIIKRSQWQVEGIPPMTVYTMEKHL